MSAARAVAIIGNIKKVRDPIFLEGIPDLRALGGMGYSMLAFITGDFAMTPEDTTTGWFLRDDNDLTSLDDGMDTIVSVDGRRWKRLHTNLALIVAYTNAAAGSALDAQASSLTAENAAADAGESETQAAIFATAAENSANSAFAQGKTFVDKATGVAAVAAGETFGVVQKYNSGAIDVYTDTAGVGVLTLTKPYGVGELAKDVQTRERLEIEDWPAGAPDVFIDPLEMFQYDGRIIPNASKLLTNPPNKNMIATATGDMYFGTGGTPAPTAYVRRVVGAGGLNTGVEWAFVGANVNVDYIPIFNAVMLEAGTYRFIAGLRSKTAFGAQNLQWHESVGGTTSIFATAEGAYVDTATFTFTNPTRQLVSVRLRSQAAGSTFQMDRVRAFDDDGNAVPVWTDDAAGNHLRNRASSRGLFIAKGLFWDTLNSTLHASFPLAANGLPVQINDITAFGAVRAPALAASISAHMVCSSVADGSSPVGYFIGIGNPTNATNITDGCIQSTPTPLASHSLCIKGEDFHVLGTMLSNETVMKGLDGDIYWDHPRSGGVTLASPSRLGMAGNEAGQASGFKGDMAPWAFWINKGVGNAKPFNSAQIKAIMLKLKKHVQARGGRIQSWRDILFADGDSRNNWLSAAPNGPGWTGQIAKFEFFGAGLPSLKAPQVGWSSTILGNPGDVEPVIDTAWVGSTMWSRKNWLLARIEACHELGLRIFYTWVHGLNDTIRIPANPLQYSLDEQVLMQIIRNALDAGGIGSRFILATETPRHTEIAYEAPRLQLDVYRRAYPPSLIHGLADLAADPVLGTYSATTAPPEYVDNLHWNGVGSLHVANIFKPLIEPFRLY